MTLCIVDMQTGFLDSKTRDTVKATVELVRKAKKNREGIVVLQYAGEGQTHSSIRKALKGYRKVRFERKWEDDGSIEFLHACRKGRFSTRKVLVCGVNVHYCVIDTIRGIKRQRPRTQIVVVRKATNDHYHNRTEQRKLLEQSHWVDEVV